MNIPTGSELAAALRARGHVVPLGVHVVLLRNRHGVVDRFDDMLVMMRGESLLMACRCTTDPGKGPRMNPKNPKGCAVWAEGQVIDGLKLGEHHPGKPGAYPALVPARPIPVLRYSGLDDATGTPDVSWAVQIHRASATHESTVVGDYSEGCAPVANPAEYDDAAHPMSPATVLGIARSSGQARFTETLMVWG